MVNLSNSSNLFSSAILYSKLTVFLSACKCSNDVGSNMKSDNLLTLDKAPYATPATFSDGPKSTMDCDIVKPLDLWMVKTSSVLTESVDVHYFHYQMN